MMEGGLSWVKQHQYNSKVYSWETILDQRDFDSFSESIDEENNILVSIDSILPVDLFEQILSRLPVSSLLRVGSVCKRWHVITSSKRFLWNNSDLQVDKPWYFMFTSSNYGIGYAYDPTLRKWHDIDLPDIVNSNWYTTSSHGLVCFMDSDNKSEIHICNPITKSYKKLSETPGPKLCDYNAISISFNRMSQGYNIFVVKSKQQRENLYFWDIMIHIYDSETMAWTTPISETLYKWRAGDESVICDGELYFMVYSTQVGTHYSMRHLLTRYNHSKRSSHCLLPRSFIPAPCALTCCRLMNLKEKLVLVGGIKKEDRFDIIKGIGIWVLKGREWQELARVPHKFLHGFKKLDDVFGCGGTDELIYIHSYGGRALLVFDMNSKKFNWSHECPISKKFPLRRFIGFCFEPRLKTSP